MSARTPEAPAVSVVIPTWNGGERFRVLLDVLAEQEIEGGHELIVVDSGSTDGSREAAEASGARIHTIPQSEFDHGATRNLGIGMARASHVALLTQDAVPMDRTYLAALVRPFADPAVAGVYARQYPRPDCDPLLAERLRQWSASRDRPEVSCLERGDAAASQRMFDELPPLQRYLASIFDNVASCLRREVWERHPFPRRNFGEDVAWGRAALLAGHAIAFEPEARVEHSHRIDTKREFLRLYRDHKNLYDLFGLRNVPSWGDVWRGWAHQRRFYKELLAGQELSERDRLYWRLYSIPYGLFETMAQFLGARSHWKVNESRFWAWADRRICAD